MTLKEIVIGPFAVSFLGACGVGRNSGLTELTAAVSTLFLGAGFFAGYTGQRIARLKMAHQDMQIRSARIHIDQRDRESRFGQQIANIGGFYTFTDTTFTRADRDNYRHSAISGGHELYLLGLNNNYYRRCLKYYLNNPLVKN